MKKIAAAFFLLFSSSQLFSQITIGSNDFAVGGDTLRVSLTNSVPSGTSLSTNGANAFWDYSALVPVSQDIDTFLAVTSTGLTYSVYFANFPFNTNRANIAARGVDLSAAGGAVPITDVYNFYYNSSSNYKQVGFGANISGVSTPVPYGNKDIVYNFPCNFGDIDSSDSDYSITIPNQGHADGQQHRVNTVDGWGTLITPFGTFNTLRVVSELTGSDSVFISSFGFGFSFPRNKTKEYKWLTTNGKIPVLQINVSVNGQTETVTSVRYKDFYRDLTVGFNDNSQALSVKIFPNPSAGEQLFMELGNLKNGKCKIDVYSVSGMLVTTIVKTVNQGNIELDELKNLAPGYYNLNVSGDLGRTSFNWLKN